MSTALEATSFRARCTLLGTYPMQHVNILERFEDQISKTSPFMQVATVIEDYEAALDARKDINSMTLRAVLGDPVAKGYLHAISRQLLKDLFDKVNAHLCQYRILDFEVGCCSESGPRSSPPRQPQRLRTQDYSAKQLKFIKKLSHWKSILTTFNDAVPDNDTAPQAAVMDLNSSFRRSFGHLQCLSEDFATEQIDTIVQNFRVAAMHLTLLQESGYDADTLPDMPTTPANSSSLSHFLPQQDLDKYEDATRKKLCAFMQEHSIGELRLPLHISLLVSMLLLLHPAKLIKAQYPRPSIHDLSVAIGNVKPSILIALEREIWNTLLKIAEDSTTSAIYIAFRALIASDIFQKALGLSEHDPAFSFYQLDAGTPSLATSTSGAPHMVDVGNSVPTRLEHTRAGEDIPQPPVDVVLPPIQRILSPQPEWDPSPPPARIPSPQPEWDLSSQPERDPSPPPRIPSPQLQPDPSPPSERIPSPQPQQDSSQPKRVPTLQAGHGSGTTDEDVFMGDEIDLDLLNEIRGGTHALSSSAKDIAGQMDIDLQEVGEGNTQRSPTVEPTTSPEGNATNRMQIDPTDSDDDAEGEDDILFPASSARVRPTARSSKPNPVLAAPETQATPMDEAPSEVVPHQELAVGTSGVRRSSRVSPSKAAVGIASQKQYSKRKRSNKSSAIKSSATVESEVDDDNDPAQDVWVKVQDAFLVDKEPTTITTNDVPPLHIGDRVTTYLLNGNEMSFEPIAHHEGNLEIIDKIIQSVKENFQQDKPLHVLKDESNPSTFTIYTQDDFDELEDSVVQDVLRRQHIVVTNRPHAAVSFKAALNRLAPLQRVTEIQDQSLGANAGPQSGKVVDLLHASQYDQDHPQKILNALTFPNSSAGTEPNSYSSDCHAHYRVKGQEGWLPRAFPTEDIRWGLAATMGAFHRWHIDSDGFGTFIEPTSGVKWWLLARPIGTLNTDVFDTTQFLFDDQFDLDTAGNGLFAVEAVLLEPGSMLIMRPNTLHAVYSVSDSTCRGGHYYATSTMKDTFVGLVHTLMCDKYITNISHGPSRFILAEMINFFHASIVKKNIVPDEPAFAHIPDVTTDTGFADIMVICALGTLLNVLSFQTYCAPNGDGKTLMDDVERQLWFSHDVNAFSEEERKLLCLARGQAFEIVVYLCKHFNIRNDTKSIHAVFVSGLVQMCKMILHYKDLVDKQEVHCNPNFTIDKIHIQISALLSMPFLEYGDYNTTNWMVPLHDGMDCPMLPDAFFGHLLEPIPDVQYHRQTLAQLFKFGETTLDKKFAQSLNIKEEQTVMKDVDIPDISAHKKRKRDA